MHYRKESRENGRFFAPLVFITAKLIIIVKKLEIRDYRSLQDNRLRKE
jgi:hypothetical protein